jgi:hypothetical protein
MRDVNIVSGFDSASAGRSIPAMASKAHPFPFINFKSVLDVTFI